MTTEPSSNFQRLNEEFYASEPSTYFRDRLRLLVVRAARPDVITSAIREGISWGALRLGIDEDDTFNDSSMHAADIRFVVTESQVLLHHAAEALLRMFLAHAGRPACPWLEMSALLDFREFREQLGELAEESWPTDRLEAAGDVFCGGVPTGVPPAEWLEARETAVRLVRHLARHLDTDKNLYNSAKHGLTALGGEGSLSLTTEDPTQSTVEMPSDEIVTLANGVNVVYLEREGKVKTGATWFQKTQWASPEKAAWLTHLAILQMEQLWTVARWHYLGGPRPDRLRIINAAALDVLKDFGGGTSFRRSVATEGPT